MGVHSGPINAVRDVNDRLNVTGAGINVAQRVMDCGDAGDNSFVRAYSGRFDPIPALATVFARSWRV
jgi:hypothetical protein